MSETIVPLYEEAIKGSLNEFVQGNIEGANQQRYQRLPVVVRQRPKWCNAHRERQTLDKVL